MKSRFFSTQVFTSIHYLIVAAIAIIFVLIPAQVALADFMYTVKKGDTLWILSNRFNTTIEGIKKANGLTASLIISGQTLCIPQQVPPQYAGTEGVYHTVKSGESLYIIARRYGTTVEKLIKLNGLTSTEIYPGQLLQVADFFKYTIRPGDSLFLIARRFGTTVDRLMSFNKLSSTEIWAGSVLKVPVSDGEVSRSAGNNSPPPDLKRVDGWINVPPGVKLYYPVLGDNLWKIANMFRTSKPAIIETNHLQSELIMPGQALFVPVGSKNAVTGIDVAPVPAPEGYGELLEWKLASWLFPPESKGILRDLVSGLEFRIFRLGGSNHADCEPLTTSDTKIMKQIFGGQWSWRTRAALLKVNGRIIACSMAGMPDRKSVV